MIEKYYAAHLKTQLDASRYQHHEATPQEKGDSKERSGPSESRHPTGQRSVDHICLYDGSVANSPRDGGMADAADSKSAYQDIKFL